MATETLSEAGKMRLVPGIYFGEQPRRAKITGTGLDVWEIINAWRFCDGSLERLRDYFDWLSDEQLRTAVRYYELFPEEVDADIAENDRVLEDLRVNGPFLGDKPYRA